MRVTKNILVLSALLVGLTAQAQMTVTPATAQEMIEQLEGQGVTILNPVLSVGIPGVSGGLFEVTDPNFDIDEGVLLTTGRITNAPGPNNLEGKSYVTIQPGDPDLSFISGYASADACVLEFDIIPAGDTLRFDFSFASEEYDEYVCTNFNDAFAFILTGVTDPLEVNGNFGIPNKKNLAIVPGTSANPDWVSINTINGGNPSLPSCGPVNEQFYHQNPINPLAQIQYDGWTRGLTAFADSLTPCNTYHLKLVIADASDRLWDSGVFIEKITSNEVTLTVETDGGNQVMYEECNNATVSFCYDNPVLVDTDVQFQLSGDAINGTDYDLIQNADPNAILTATVLAGETCAEIQLNTIDDDIGEPLETVTITVFNPNTECDLIQPILDEQTIFLYDSLEVFIVGDLNLCLGESTVLSVDSGGPQLMWGASPSLVFNPDNTSVPVNITPTQDTDILVSTSIAACVATDEVTVQVSELDLDFTVLGESCTDVCNGSIDLTILDGIMPFNVLWNDGVMIGDGPATDEDQTGLCQGTYWVRVTDAAGCVTIDTVQVGVGNVVTLSAPALEYNGGFNVSCFGACDGEIFPTAGGGSGTYTFTIDSPGGAFSNLCAGTYNVTATDIDSGCSDSQMITISEPSVKEIIITDIQPVPCNGGADGCATVLCQGGSGNPVSYEWALAGAVVGTGPTFCGPAAQYTVTAIDDNGCEASLQVSLIEPATGLTGIVVSQDDPACNGENTGAVCVSGAGGTPFISGDPYTYMWSSGLGTDPCLTNLEAGLYVVTISDAAGCSIDLTVNITEPTQIEVLILDRNDIQCEGQDCGSALGIGIGGTGPYTYEWLPVDCPDITGFPVFAPAAPFCLPCDYILTVTDANGCKADTTISIDIISPAMDLDFDVTDVLCHGDSTGAINLTMSGGIPPYIYEWEGGNCNQGPFNTQDLNNVCGGLWCLTVTDQNGCMVDTCLFVEEPPELGALFDMTPTDCFDACTGELDLIPYGGTPFMTGNPYTYEWQGPVDIGDVAAFDTAPTFSTDEDLTLLCKGWYRVTVTDSLGCTFMRIITLTAPDDMLIENVMTSDYNGWQISCPDACDGWISVDVTGGTPGVDGFYCTWFEPEVPFIQQEFGLDSLGGLCASQDTLGYEIIKEDANGCIQNTFVIMAEPDEFTFNTENSVDVSCSGGSDGSIVMNIEGGTPPYSITVENAANVEIFSAPNSLTGEETVTGLPEGCYTIFVSDQNGCMDQDEICISVPNPVVVVMNNVPYGDDYGVSCAGECNGIVYATVQGGTPYVGNVYDFTWWDTDCGVDSISADPFVIDSLCAGDYFVTVSDSLGCSVCPADGWELTAPSLLVDTLAQVDSVDCFGNNNGSIVLNIEGGTPNYTYNWTGTTPPITQGAAFQNGLPPGVYDVLVTDMNECDTLLSYVIDEPDTLIAVATAPFIDEFNVTCGGDCDGSIELSVSGGTPPYSVIWSGGGCVGGSTDFSFDGCVCAGTYSYTVTDANSCEVMGSITLVEPEPITVMITEAQSILCFDDCNGQLSVQSTTGGSGVYVSYAWSNGDMGPLTNANLCASPPPYTVTVTDNNNCEGMGSYDLMQPDTLECNCVPTNVSCFGFNDGSISCTPTGGSAPYSILWNGPNGFLATGSNISDLQPGEYCKTVSDANGCQATECITITEPDIILVDIAVLEYEGGFGVSCFGACDGEIDITITGGTGPFTFVPDTATLNMLCAGDYPIEIIDANGCMFNDTVTVTEGLELEVSLSTTIYECETNISCQGACDGFIQSAVSGGDSSSYTFYWIEAGMPNDTFLVSTDDDAISLLCAGDYILYVEDGNGCFGSESITLTEPSMPFTVDVTLFTYPSGDNISCAGACDGSATFTPNGECGTVMYTWTDGSGVVDPTMICAPDLTLVAIDAANCTYTEVFNITEPPALITAVDTEEALCFGDSSGTVCFETIGGSPAYTTTWTGPSPLTGPDSCAINLPQGTYTYTVTDINGCEEISTVTIDEPDSLHIELFSPLASNNIPFNISTPGGMDGFIDATITGGTLPYNCQWSGGNSPDTPGCGDLDSLIAGEYCLLVTDANGCEESLCIEVTDPDLLELPNGISPNDDLINDGLEIPGLEVYPDNTVQIFNRWGNQIFERTNYSNSDQWKGEGSNGNIVPDGTYFVILVVKDAFGQQEELNGYLELRR